jgi:AraC-like DNA-binding protein
LSELALECGYADQAAFTRQFHKSVGLTPGAYRVARARDASGRHRPAAEPTLRAGR